MLVDQLVAVTDPWASFYRDSVVAQTVVAFGHVGGMVVSGGMAVAADRSAISMVHATTDEKKRYLRSAGGVHKLVIGALAITIVSGILMLTADLELFWTSPAFWTKMALVIVLLINGIFIVHQQQKLAGTHPRVSRHWRRLRTFALTSIGLWFAVLLAGVTMTTV